jgi:hypothetical protein
MEFKKFVAFNDNKKFVIEEDLPGVGAYLYVYDSSNCIYDFLQDNIEICKKVASEDYGVSYESWKEIT